MLPIDLPFKKGSTQSYTAQDGLLITGQNPASSEAVARELLALLAPNK